MRFPQKGLISSALTISIIILGLILINGSSRNVNANTDDVYRNIEVFTEVLRQVEEKLCRTSGDQASDRRGNKGHDGKPGPSFYVHDKRRI